MDIQLVPLHNHRVNAAERAIAAFKENFVTALTTVDMLCPPQLWDKFLPQVELTLNLLCFSCRNPHVSANQKLYRQLNFNKTPLTPLGTKALVYNDPATRASWVQHVTDGFYLGLANNHLLLSLFLHPVDLALPLCGHMAAVPCPLPSPCCI
jgi:hypothetical protein